MIYSMADVVLCPWIISLNKVHIVDLKNKRISALQQENMRLQQLCKHGVHKNHRHICRNYGIKSYTLKIRNTNSY